MMAHVRQLVMGVTSRRAAFALLVALVLQGAAALAADSVEIDYIPFDVRTYHAITREGITSVPSASAKIDSFDSRLLRLRADIEMAPAGPPIKDGFIRARIRYSSGWTAYIDMTGGVEFSGRTVSLDQATRNRVDMNLALLTGADIRTLKLNWAVEVAKTFVEESTDWQETDYSLGIDHAFPPFEVDTVIVQIIYHDDLDVGPDENGVLHAGGGKSFELHYDPETRQLLRRLWYQ